MGRKADYGRGHPAFLTYIKMIVDDPAYAGMPDVWLDDGSIQWEAPSNRPGSNKFTHTHRRRLDWWRAKALSIGLDPTKAPQWISRTAKAIHPTKSKPCKKCGQVLAIGYFYPSGTLTGRLKALSYVGEVYAIETTEHIESLLRRLYTDFGSRILSDLPTLLRAKGISVPAKLADVDAWVKWVRDEYCPKEPATLSPGAMSNAPDRLDGFHSFNRCCRSTADRGRSKANLRSYTTDRRAFEYWVEGDWIAADRLMALVKATDSIRALQCLNGHPGPCDADHIGPISLGFCHRAEFQLLCPTCNSAKNNRLTLSDVAYLRARSSEGQQVASWYCENLWSELKDRVTTTEEALRLTKMMRDNRHTASTVLGAILQEGHLSFLTTLLGLEHATKDIEFKALQVRNHIVSYEDMRRVPRTTSYVLEQQARRIRVAESAITEYLGKENRNAEFIRSDDAVRDVNKVLALLKAGRTKAEEDTDAVLRSALDSGNEAELRNVLSQLPGRVEPKHYAEARQLLRAAMDSVASVLVSRWGDRRYSREMLDEADDVEKDDADAELFDDDGADDGATA